jgi:hypothetical protein
MSNGKEIASGTKVRVVKASEIPQWSEWDDDGGRSSTQVKRRLQQLFFKGDKKVNAEVVYVAKETDRERLRKLGRCKVRLRDVSGSCVVITADTANLEQAR